jgi:hypothetical protein
LLSAPLPQDLHHVTGPPEPRPANPGRGREQALAGPVRHRGRRHAEQIGHRARDQQPCGRRLRAGRHGLLPPRVRWSAPRSRRQARPGVPRNSTSNAVLRSDASGLRADRRIRRPGTRGPARRPEGGGHGDAKQIAHVCACGAISARVGCGPPGRLAGGPWPLAVAKGRPGRRRRGLGGGCRGRSGPRSRPGCRRREVFD